MRSQEGAVRFWMLPNRRQREPAPRIFPGAPCPHSRLSLDRHIQCREGHHPVQNRLGDLPALVGTVKEPVD